MTVLSETVSLGRQLNRRKTAEKEMESLEGDRQKADEFLRLDAAIRKQQNILYQTHIAHAATNVEKASVFVYPIHRWNGGSGVPQHDADTRWKT